MIGQYVRQAIGASFNKTVNYPSEPASTNHMNELENDHRGQVMSDGERFAQFAINHNRALRKSRKQENNQDTGDKQAI